MSSSYQIKSTPFFRRLVAKSKQNGELQKLKEEYERIKEFNERSIEKKMRQVRLKRLFKEIEEIKETILPQSHRSARRERKKTQEDLRAEMIRRANELGKEYSKFNALHTSCSPRPVQNVNTITQEKFLSIRRIDYGNKISRINMQKISALKKSNSSSQPKISPSQNLYTKRIKYGNDCMRHLMHGRDEVSEGFSQRSHSGNKKMSRSSKRNSQAGTATDSQASNASVDSLKKCSSYMVHYRARRRWQVAIQKICRLLKEYNNGLYDDSDSTLESNYDTNEVDDDTKYDISQSKTSDTSISSYYDSSSEVVATDKYNDISAPQSLTSGLADFRLLDEEMAKLDGIPTLFMQEKIPAIILKKTDSESKEDGEYGVRKLRAIFENQN